MTHENYEITRRLGFELLGMETSQRRKSARFSPGDRILLYVRDRRAFPAIATVTSERFEDDTPHWKHHNAEECFPFRVKIKTDLVLRPHLWIDALQVGPRLEYVRKWPPEDWELALFGSVHIIPQKDFNFIEEEMRRSVSRRKPANGNRHRKGNRRRRGRGSVHDQRNGAHTANGQGTSESENSHRESHAATVVESSATTNG